MSAERLAASLREVAEGQALSHDIACEMLRSDGEILRELLATARILKERHHPGVITYSRKVFLPLTNLCRDYCGYCTYRRDPGEPGRAHHDARRSSVGRATRRAARLHRSAFLPRRQTGDALSGDARDFASARLSQHAALSGSHVRAGSAGDVAAATRQSRLVERQLDCTFARKQSEPGPDAGEHQHQSCWRRTRQSGRRTSIPRFA